MREYLRICSASSLVITMSVTPLPHFLGVQPGGRESRRNADYQSCCPKITAELTRPSTVTGGQVKSQLQINSGNFSPELCPVHSLRAHISFLPGVLGFSQTHTDRLILTPVAGPKPWENKETFKHCIDISVLLCLVRNMVSLCSSCCLKFKNFLPPEF